MAHLVTPSPSSHGADMIDLTADDDDLATDVIAKNRVVILELEQKYILTPGILTIAPSGQLQVDLSREEPDQGTMVGLYPALPPPDDYEAQISSWLRDYLIKELNLFGSGPPSACGSLYDQMVRSKEVGREGTNLSVSSAALLLDCGTMSLRSSISDLHEFHLSSDPVCEDTYAMEFGIVEGVIKRLVGWDASQSVRNRLLATRPTGNKREEHSPTKRRKLSKDDQVAVAQGGTVAPHELPKDIKFLLDLGSKGMVMKGVVDSALEEVVITPVSQLIEKLDIVTKGLREQEKDEERKQKEHHVGGDHSSDSGVSACSP